MNEFNPEGKDIRFIDSHYNDLFRVPDGGCIQIHYPDETVVKPCKFIDEYHTQIGYNVFHICQFAEIMERNGATYMAEPEIMGLEAAWQVGRDKILAVQTYEDGYDYTLYDSNYNEIDGGQLDNPDLSMIEARTEILESFNLGNRELRAMVYEDVREQADLKFLVQMAENRRNNEISQFAGDIVAFASDFHHYEFMDTVDDPEEFKTTVAADLMMGNPDAYYKFLSEIVDDNRDEAATKSANLLMEALDRLFPDSMEKGEKKPSVREQLAKIQEHTPAAKPSHKRTEPER